MYYYFSLEYLMKNQFVNAFQLLISIQVFLFFKLCPYLYFLMLLIALLTH